MSKDIENEGNGSGSDKDQTDTETHGTEDKTNEDMNYLQSEQINEEGDDDGESQVTGEEHTEEGSASECRWVQIKID